VTKGLLEPRQRLQAQSTINLLHDRINDRNVVLPAEERRDRNAAPQEGQRLKSFLGRRLGLSGKLVRITVSGVLFERAFRPTAAVRPAPAALKCDRFHKVIVRAAIPG
jgi:hypothetical protein